MSRLRPSYASWRPKPRQISSRSAVVAAGAATWSTKVAMFCSMPTLITRALGPSRSSRYSGMTVTISAAISLSRPGSSGRITAASSRGICSIDAAPAAFGGLAMWSP